MATFSKKITLFIAVNPIGSKFAKALQSGLKETGISTARVSLTRGEQRKQQHRKVFTITSGALNKIQQLRLFSENNVSCPAFTTNSADVGSLGSKCVFARTLINSTSGRGIVEFEVGKTVPPAPLYTAYIPKKAEYRVHVFNGKVIDVQQKRKKSGEELAETRNTRVRNLSNGYVYCRDNISCPENINELAISAVKALKYVYGAVDIIYNEKQNKCFVLEVNSRPGLMGTTIQKYAQAVKEMYVG